MTSSPSRVPFPVASPAEAGVCPGRLAEYIETLGHNGCHALMILRDGKCLARAAWQPYSFETPHILFSVSKSFIAVALGFAVGEGVLSLDEKIVDIFRDHFPCPPCDFMRRVTIRHLLTMSLGHRGKTDLDFLGAADWLDEALRLYLETEPGTDFSYDNRCTYLCSVILQRRTGMTALAYLEKRLFNRIGIHDARWEQSAAGVNVGGWGLRLGVESMARFGQFLLQRGTWEGERLLDGDWLDQATARHIDTRGKSIIPAEDCWNGYGWFFWRSTHAGAFRADGALGQTIIVMPPERLVIAMTAGTATRNKLIEATWERLCPGVDAVDADAAAVAAKQKRLDALLASLAIPAPRGKNEPENGLPSTIANASGRRFTIAENRFGITALAWRRGDPECLELSLGERNLTIRAGRGCWLENDLGEGVGLGSDVRETFHRRVAAAAAWEGEALLFHLAYVETPFIDSLRLCFRGDSLRGVYECGPFFGARGGRAELLGVADAVSS